MKTAGSMLGSSYDRHGDLYIGRSNADGSILGQGQGIDTTNDGEAVVWTGDWLGQVWARRAGVRVTRGMLFFKTTSKKLAKLNNACGAFEFEVAPDGSTVFKDLGMEVGCLF